jgi:hypothetical protein
MKVSAVSILFLATAPFQGVIAYEQATGVKSVRFSFVNRRLFSD